jgi:hypothetical protein
MTKLRLFGSALPAMPLRLLLIATLCATPFVSLEAQDDDHDHDHDHLHFSHPMVTESPSPDTKIRVDYVAIRVGAPIDAHVSVVRVEGEYAFNHSVSFAVVAPFAWLTSPGAERVSGLGNIEVSLKAASLAFGERGLLFGGGISAGLPTGDDSKSIGSSHIVEIEPFLDAGYKKEKLEFVGVGGVSSTFHRRVGEDPERDFTFNFSTLYRIHERVEGLLEVATARALVGPESGEQTTFIAPGVKVYPFSNRALMFGGSLEIGTGDIRNTRALLLSGFYHF